MQQMRELPLRHELMELGGAELMRARRYGRPFALVMLELRKRDAASGAKAEPVLDALLRTGADRAMHLEPGRFVLLLPETTLAGAMHLGARLQRALVLARLPARVGFAGLVRDDARFPDMLARAQTMLEAPR